MLWPIRIPILVEMNHPHIAKGWQRSKMIVVVVVEVVRLLVLVPVVIAGFGHSFCSRPTSKICRIAGVVYAMKDNSSLNLEACEAKQYTIVSVNSVPFTCCRCHPHTIQTWLYKMSCAPF